MPIAYIEMPEENTVITAKVMRVEAAGLFVEAGFEILGHRAGSRAVVKRHHEDADEHHRRDRADPIEMARRDAVLRARGAHADHFLRAEVGGDERQAGDPGGNRAAGEEEVGARLDRPPQPEADAQDEHEVDRHDGPVDIRKTHAPPLVRVR